MAARDYPLRERIAYACRKKLENVRFVANELLLTNPASRRRLLASGVELTAAQRSIVAALRDRGHAILALDELVPSRELRESVRAHVEAFATSDVIRERLERFERERDRPSWKDYIVQQYGVGKTLPGDHPLLELALSPPILDTVNGFLGLWSRLKMADAWYTMPVEPSRERVSSQNWHRDPEDRRILKVFYYASDVDSSNGALEYVPESRPGRRHSHLWPRANGSGTRGYIPEATIDGSVRPEDIITVAAPRGSLVFVDTSGFHRGGRALERDRVFATWMYTSPASLFARRFEIEPDRPPVELSEAARFALG